MTARDNFTSGRKKSSSPGGTGARYSGLAQSSRGGRASFGACPGQLVARALDAVTEAGDMLSFSRTSDGGAICLFVKSGLESWKVYANTQDELDAAVELLSNIT